MLQVAANRKLLGYFVPIGICLFAWGMANSMAYLPEPIGSRSDMFVKGVRLTISLSFWSGLLALIVGVLVGISRSIKNIWIRNSALFYVWLLTGTPLLTQILFMYYVLPIFMPMLKLSEYTSALIALSLNIAAYNADVVRAGILSVPKEQEQSGLSLGLNRLQVLRFIIFPQAMRFSMLPLMNNFIVLLKDSSLASAIGLLDLTLVGTRVISETFEPIPVLFTVSAVYLFMTTLCKIGVYWFENLQK